MTYVVVVHRYVHRGSDVDSVAGWKDDSLLLNLLFDCLMVMVASRSGQLLLSDTYSNELGFEDLKQLMIIVRPNQL